MDDDSSFDSDPFDSYIPHAYGRADGNALTLALLEDLAALLQQHGFPPLRGYALAEITTSLYRLQSW